MLAGARLLARQEAEILELRVTTLQNPHVDPGGSGGGAGRQLRLPLGPPGLSPILARIEFLRRPKTAPAHSRRVRKDDHDRFWWHTLHATNCEPPIQATLDEWLPHPR